MNLQEISMDNIRKAIHFLELAEAGEVVQQKYLFGCTASWVVMTGDPQFNFTHYEYRVEPKPKECYANIYPNSGSAVVYDMGSLADARCARGDGGKTYKCIEVMDND